MLKNSSSILLAPASVFQPKAPATISYKPRRSSITTSGDGISVQIGTCNLELVFLLAGWANAETLLSSELSVRTSSSAASPSRFRLKAASIRLISAAITLVQPFWVKTFNSPATLGSTGMSPHTGALAIAFNTCPTLASANPTQASTSTSSRSATYSECSSGLTFYRFNVFNAVLTSISPAECQVKPFPRQSQPITVHSRAHIALPRQRDNVLSFRPTPLPFQSWLRRN